MTTGKNKKLLRYYSLKGIYMDMNNDERKPIADKSDNELQAVDRDERYC